MVEEIQGGLTPAEIFRKTRRIEIRTSRLVNELFGGTYHSTFKGRGMEFVDVREYVPGDDVRAIHWNITARLGQPYIKRFVEERELTILIAVDVSGSQRFGTRVRFKSDLAAELVSLISFAALKNNDKVGLLMFSDHIESYTPPRKRRSHALRLVRDVLSFNPKGKKTDITMALQYLNRVQKKRAIVFLISDFLGEGYDRILASTKRHHDTIAIVLEDPMEQEWPKIGKILIEDAETGRQAVAGENTLFRSQYIRQQNTLREKRDLQFAKMKLDRVVLKTNHDYVRPLLYFFQDRTRRFR